MKLRLESGVVARLVITPLLPAGRPRLPRIL